MTGNVWEWCWDWYGEYSGDSQVDPKGPKPYFFRIVRGGGWAFYASYARNTYRGRYSESYNSYYLGFRMALPAGDRGIGENYPVNKVSWHEGNSSYATQPVGEKQANELGIFDMTGNVWEWCWD